MAPPFTRQISDLRLHPRQIGALQSNMLHQKFACGVKPHPAGQTFKDWPAEFLLELLDAPVQRRGGQVCIFGGLTD
jgi:hypothetical protein